MIQFAKAVGLEVSLTSYGLLQDLLLRARGVGNLAGRLQPGQFLFQIVVRSTVVESVASQS